MNLHISTPDKHKVIDITDEIARQLPAGSGIAHAFVQHTTCALTTADLDPGTDLDLLDALADLLPRKVWRHPHDNSYEHVSSHLLASLIGPSVSVPFADGKLCLGTWQRIILVELDGPRERQLTLTFLKETTHG